jgi:hypothetical protein
MYKWVKLQLSVIRLEEVLIKVCIPKGSDKALHMFKSWGVRGLYVQGSQGYLASFGTDLLKGTTTENVFEDYR